MISYVNNRGKTAILWNDSIIGSSLKGDVVCQFWMSQKKLETYKESIENDYPIIDSNFKSFYLDYPIEVVPLNTTYNYDSIFDKKTSGNGLMGYECAIWTEYIDSRTVLDRRVFPRLFAVAEAAWTNDKSYSSFKKRLISISNWINDIGVVMPQKQEWESTGLKKILYSVKFYSKMINLKMLKIVFKISKQSKAVMNSKIESLEVESE